MKTLTNLSRHLNALVNATTQRIKYLTSLDPRLTKEQRDELRWLYRVQRPALDAATRDFNELCKEIG